jgi:bifunctional UDP-N-acetylglucosamine pyrophosphorylase/glucosamine-1-phosphate N-acetyltransferase
MLKISAVILAAGKSTRMKYSITKVLRRVSGRAILEHVIESCLGNGINDIIIVVGSNFQEINKFMNEKYKNILKPRYVIQKRQLGTAHAVKVVLESKTKLKDNILILNGDVPVSRKTIRSLIHEFEKQKTDGIIAVSEIPNPEGYGRVIQDFKGNIIKIVEEKDADKKEKQIKLINGGIYIFKKVELKKYIGKIKLNPRKKEYYLTDIVEIMADAGKKIAAKLTPFKELTGVNNRLQLMEVAEIKNRDMIVKLSRQGVTVRDFNTIFIDETVKVGRETVVRYYTNLRRNTKIGQKCLIGPGSIIENTVVGKEVEIIKSIVRESKIGDNTKIGPFSHLRAGTIIGKNCRIGNFVEIKNSRIGNNTKIAHMTYIGDAKIGNNVNVGAGTITCNYDGFKKHRTIIGNNVFIGSGVKFIAPVKVGNNAVIAAGSVITEDVPPYALAIARARQENKLGWAKKMKRGIQR